MKVNRLQGLVLGFFLAAWTLLLILVIAFPHVLLLSFKLQGRDPQQMDLALLAVLSVFLVLLAVGVIRRWRWTFWLVLLAFLAGLLRVPVSLLELAGRLPAAAPVRYLVVQAMIGLVQFGIGLAMLSSWRRAGIWGPT